MNELVNGDGRGLLTAPSRTKGGPFVQTEALTERSSGTESGSKGVVDRPAQVLSRFHANRLLILAALSLCAVLYLFSQLYFPAYAVVVNGKNLGMVRNRADFQQAVKRVETKASQVLGREYTLQVHPNYKFGYTFGAQYVPSSVFDGYLTQQVGEMAPLYAVIVNGAVVAASQEKDAVNQVLAQMLSTYWDENTLSASFVQRVSVRYQYVPTEKERDITAIKTILSGNTREETVYSVTSGDTVDSIIKVYHMTKREFLSRNPGLANGALKEGQSVRILKNVPLLSVRTTKTVSHIRPISYAVQTIQNPSMYRGDQKVVTAGKNGSMQVMEEQAYINGTATSRTAVFSSKMLADPVAQIVAVGTAARPLTELTGVFQWPAAGRITSPFGYRHIFGSVSFHSGVDIANSPGTAIKASDGGTVSFAGRKGSYGNLVIIRHGNGRETYYGHCSSILVKQGDRVYQGQMIAKMGSTGRSTGSHLHFEVRMNQVAVDPLAHLNQAAS